MSDAADFMRLSSLFEHSRALVAAAEASVYAARAVQEPPTTVMHASRCCGGRRVVRVGALSV